MKTVYYCQIGFSGPWNADELESSYVSRAACVQVDCLEARNREQSAGYNELALSLLDVLGAVGAGGCFSVQHHAASLFRLLRAVGQLLGPQLRREAPLKLRAAAAEVIEKLAAARQLAPVLLPCLGERLFLSALSCA